MPDGCACWQYSPITNACHERLARLARPRNSSGEAPGRKATVRERSDRFGRRTRNSHAAHKCPGHPWLAENPAEIFPPSPQAVGRSARPFIRVREVCKSWLIHNRREYEKHDNIDPIHSSRAREICKHQLIHSSRVREICNIDSSTHFGYDPVPQFVPTPVMLCPPQHKYALEVEVHEDVGGNVISGLNWPRTGLAREIWSASKVMDGGRASERRIRSRLTCPFFLRRRREPECRDPQP